MLCLELVEIAPRMMSSTPRRKGMGWASLYHVIPKSFSGLDIWDCFGHIIVHSISAFLAKERLGFCSTCWDPCGSVF